LFLNLTYGGFRHMAYSCRNVEEKELAQILSNKFKVLRSRIMKKGEGEKREVKKDRKEILREERAKMKIKVKQTKKGEKGEIIERGIL